MSMSMIGVRYHNGQSLGLAWLMLILYCLSTASGFLPLVGLQFSAGNLNWKISIKYEFVVGCGCGTGLTCAIDYYTHKILGIDTLEIHSI